jgi:hypothetical protein
VKQYRQPLFSASTRIRQKLMGRKEPDRLPDHLKERMSCCCRNDLITKRHFEKTIFFCQNNVVAFQNQFKYP